VSATVPGQSQPADMTILLTIGLVTVAPADWGWGSRLTFAYCYVLSIAGLLAAKCLLQ
jgi:hypothetical protein